MFNVKLESFETAAKPKVIREVKAMVPNLTLIEVSFRRLRSPFPTQSHGVEMILQIGQEVCGVSTQNSQGEPIQGRRRETEGGLRETRSCRCPRVDSVFSLYTLTSLITIAIPQESELF